MRNREHRVRQAVDWIVNKFFELGRNIRWQLEDERGIGVVEVILILVVLIGLVLIFKSQLTSLVNDIFNTITSESSSV